MTRVTVAADVDVPDGGRPAARAVSIGRRRRRTGTGQIVVGIALLAPIVIMAVAAPWITTQDPATVDIGRRLLPPAWLEGGRPEFLLGTDQIGRDILARLVYGARVSLLVGVVAVVGSGIIGVVIGLLVGYYKGWLDSVMMGYADIQESYPFLALAIVVVAVLGPGLTNLLLVLVVGGWVLYARVVRAEVLSVSKKDFVEGARSIGASDLHIMYRHLLPSVRSPIIIISTFNFAWFIIAEASLSFLGLGVPPSIPTWGAMMSDSRAFLNIAWWFPLFPGIALISCVLGANLLGDGLRDRWDPRMRS